LRSEFDSSLLQFKNINQQLSNQNYSIEEMKSRMKQIELSPPKQQPVAQVVQVPHECKFNPQSLSEIQTKLSSLTNAVNSLKEE
jgi:DNA repair ATPase RecN